MIRRLQEIFNALQNQFLCLILGHRHGKRFVYMGLNLVHDGVLVVPFIMIKSSTLVA